MSYDLDTISFLTALSALLMSVCMFAVSVSYPQIRGVKLWATACGAMATGCVLFWLRSQVPPIFGIFFGNFLLVVALELFYLSILAFKENVSRFSYHWVGITVFGVVLFVSTSIYPNFIARSILLSGTHSLLTFLCFKTLVIRQENKPSKSEWTMALGFLTISVVAAFRFLIFWYNAFFRGDAEISVPGFMPALIFTAFFAAVLLLSFSFLMMINERLREQVTRLATIDSLTGIYNRAAMETMINKEIERAKRHGLSMSFLILDLDHFKRVNDTYGHQVGDEALRKLVQVTSAELREHDIFGRFGGEEFTILLPDTDYESAESVAERIRQTVERTEFPAKEQPFRLTISVGLATFRADKDDFLSIFSRADKGLYKAKQTGRNQVVAVRRPKNVESELNEQESAYFDAGTDLKLI